MARIRSTFPGQWTDEDFVECQPLSRLLAIGLRNEADDQGVFEWKPVGLKMRLMPADNADIGVLLADLEAHHQVKRFTVDGRTYGAIRNFVKFQKPKKPTKVHPLPAELWDWVRMDLWGATRKKVGSEPDADQQDDGTEQDDGEGARGSELHPASASPGSEPGHAQEPRSSEPTRVQRPSVPKKSETAAQREEGGGRSRREGSTGIAKSSAGGLTRVPARDGACPPADDPGGGMPAAGEGRDAAETAALAVIRDGVVAAFERWFDLPDRPIAPADEELFAAWLAAGAERGLSPGDTSAAVVAEVQRQFRQMAARKPNDPPRSLRAVLDEDVRAAIGRAKPGGSPSGAKPPPEVPEPYRAQFTDPVEFARWVAPCRIEVEGDRATVSAPNAAHRDWVAQRLEARLRAALGVREVDVVVAIPAASRKVPA